MKNVLVIGASGFVGQHLCRYLYECDFRVTAFSRSPIDLGIPIHYLSHPSLQDFFHDPLFFKDFDAIIYAAGKAHATSNDTSVSCVSNYFSANCSDPVHIAKLSSQAGLKRFVYISSIKVNGEFTPAGQSFSSIDKHCPNDIYSLSKSFAEHMLELVLKSTSTNLVIIRPPLIYGPGVKGNLKALFNLLSFSLPLPLAAFTKNRRSFLSIYNFLDFIRVALLHHQASGHVFLVRDPNMISSFDFVLALNSCFGFKAKFFYAPLLLLHTFSFLLVWLNLKYLFHINFFLILYS